MTADIRATWREDITAAFSAVADGWKASGIKPTAEAFQMTFSSALIHLRDGYSGARADAKMQAVKKGT